MKIITIFITLCVLHRVFRVFVHISKMFQRQEVIRPVPSQISLQICRKYKQGANDHNKQTLCWERLAKGNFRK